MWRGPTGSLGPCGGGGIAGMVMGFQLVFSGSEGVQGSRGDVLGLFLLDNVALRAEGRWALGWTAMWSRMRWLALFLPSVARNRLSPGMCWCWCFCRGSPRARDSTPSRGLACSLDLLGRMYMPWSPGTVPRYMLLVMLGAWSGWDRGELHGVEQGGSWCSQREWSMPYGLMCTAKGLMAPRSLWS